ncbi:hypothetical protein [Sphingosinicella sp. YJ22]|uniref:hypothetical protein n=1 Tax=Sphingosinicella sp. YJ22 TaxID=1104780 RepID=UPI0014081C41|nr:hypothetical protein [Sphingosinicella sp. YJ22]
MKARIEDQKALRAIAPAALVAYARSQGWRRAERYGDHSDVYARTDAPELILPGTDALADYPLVVSEVLRFLARIEERDELQIYRDLIGADRDVIRVRAPEADDDGSIRIGAGVDMVLHARDLLQASACAAKEPRASYRAGKVKDAADYMDKVRLGQTEQGSFIVTLLAPVPPNLDSAQGAFWPLESEEPFQRRVTRMLANGLDAARVAAQEAVRGDGFDAFKLAVPRGVNANLCESLAILIEQSNGLEVSVTWAKTRPTPEARRRVRFSQSEGEIFMEAARRFRLLEPRPDERLEGYVVNLGRGHEELKGRVSIRTFVDEQPVSVKVTLPPELYSEALAAHEAKAAIAITGDLKRKGQRWELYDPRELTVLEEPNEEDGD